MAAAFLTHFSVAEVTRFKETVAVARAQRRPLEVEARFDLLAPGDRPTQPLPASVFYRMQEYLRTRQIAGTRTVSNDQTQGPVRRTEAEGRVTWMTKQRLDLLRSPALGVRLAVSEERPLLQPPTSFRAEFTRTKDRLSYLIYPGVARLDMTRVTDAQRRVSYEVEVECLNLDLLYTRFMECTSIVWKWLTGSNTLYTVTELKAVAHDLALASTRVGPREDPLQRFNRDVLVQARNLKREDLVYGGLVGNPETFYEVTAKADGVRKLMVFTPSGCWAVMPPYEYNRLLAYEPLMQPLVGSWLDGEMVPVERRNAQASPPDTPYWFLIFDVLRVEGRSVQAEPLRTRLTLAKAVADIFQSHRTLRVHAKEFYPIKRVQDLFTTMSALKKREVTLAYKIDGYMFTPAQTPYNPRSHEVEAAQRCLVAVPDIVKWKPPEELTIDFAVRPGPRGLELYSSQKGQRDGVRFRGTMQHPFNGAVQTASPLLQGLEAGTVVEFGWNAEEGVLEPRRLRFDKVVGNDVRIAEDVWTDIHTPIQFDMLTGDHRATPRLRFALEWEAQKLPIAVVVRPRQLSGLLGQLQFTQPVVDAWDGQQPALFLQDPPRQATQDYYVLQDTRTVTEAPPGVCVDTWTVDQPLLSLSERQECPHYRFTYCRRTPPQEMYWPDPVYYVQIADVRGLDRLAILPPFRTAVRAQVGGQTYVAYLPSTWRLEGTPAVASRAPVRPDLLPREAQAVPDEEAQADASALDQAESVPELPEDRQVWLAPPTPPAFRPNLQVGRLETLACSWYTEYPVVRIGTVGDGNCLLHAMLQGYNPEYQAREEGRAAYARRLRTAMAEFMTLSDPESPGNTFYASAGAGAVAAVYPLDVLQALLRGSEYLGDEAYALLGLCLGVNLVVVRATGTDVYKHAAYLYPLRRQWTVVLNGTGNHYETVGLETPEGLQTAFLPEDPFVQAYERAPGAPSA